jgi:hypothetical protein
VSWENVDVSFHNSKVRYAAHSVIQVLSLALLSVLSYPVVKLDLVPSVGACSLVPF